MDFQVALGCQDLQDFRDLQDHLVIQVCKEQVEFQVLEAEQVHLDYQDEQDQQGAQASREVREKLGYLVFLEASEVKEAWERLDFLEEQDNKESKDLTAHQVQLEGTVSWVTQERQAAVDHQGQQVL